MSIFEPTNITKETQEKFFGKGPWLEEPDFLEFEHKGVKCRIIRVLGYEGFNLDHLFGGYLCGYVEIPESHPLYQTKYKDWDKLRVHGGLTFHKVLDEKTHLIGFDCSHSGDVVPSLGDIMKKHREKMESILGKSVFIPDPTYKTWDFVVGETKSLAEQVKNLEVESNSRV
jgi:hypothetical protein